LVYVHFVFYSVDLRLPWLAVLAGLPVKDPVSKASFFAGKDCADEFQRQRQRQENKLPSHSFVSVKRKPSPSRLSQQREMGAGLMALLLKEKDRLCVVFRHAHGLSRQPVLLVLDRFGVRSHKGMGVALGGYPEQAHIRFCQPSPRTSRLGWVFRH
jgi:hypothetical protein